MAAFIKAVFFVSIANMKAVILAAGKGSRMGEVTKDTPKPLLSLAGKNILFFILESFQPILEIDELFIVVRKEHYSMFEDFIKNYGSEKKITLVVQTEEIKGTYAALWSTKPFLSRNEDFIVTNGDDIHTSNTLKLLMETSGAVMVTQNIPFKEGYYHVVSEGGYFKSFLKPEKGEFEYISLVSGLYKIPFSFFSLRPVEIFGGEFGIPQTLVKFQETQPIKVIGIQDSLYINTVSDLGKAENFLKSSNNLEF